MYSLSSKWQAQQTATEVEGYTVVQDVDPERFIISINLDCNLINIYNEPVLPKHKSRFKAGPRVPTEGCKRW
jgi:hypothetical protein